MAILFVAMTINDNDDYDDNASIVLDDNGNSVEVTTNWSIDQSMSKFASQPTNLPINQIPFIEDIRKLEEDWPYTAANKNFYMMGY